jgi:SAM-dependent methyltransferase
VTVSGDERERLRQTFNQAAGSYDRARPDYPEVMFDDLVALTGLAEGDRLLEVGCGTGKATRAGIEAGGLFEVVAVRHYDWERVYSAEEYIELLGTFSGHIDMAGWQRERLFGEIRRRLARRPDGAVRRHWGAVLHVARRRDDQTPTKGSAPR